MRDDVESTCPIDLTAARRGREAALSCALVVGGILFPAMVGNGCRTVSTAQRPTYGTNGPPAGRVASPDAGASEASPARARVEAGEHYLTGEVGRMMREDQEQAKRSLAPGTKAPPPRQPDDTPLRPARRTGRPPRP